ncbi:MAG: dicarboxylate/amino acid:cation symporter [Lachnospiraceae bacterium]|nr:dicarboxylate/amino acid:cation symporter [Lachnospiraceae bacterium]
MDEKERKKTELICEEILVCLKENTAENGNVSVKVRKTLFGMKIELEAPGQKLDLLEGGNIDTAIRYKDEPAEEAIRAIILKAYGDNLKYVHKDGINRIMIRAKKKRPGNVYVTLSSLAAAVILGLLFRWLVPATVNNTLCDYIFAPFRTMFINALKIVVGPVVFFSIVTCISQFTNLSELGKIGAKVTGMYIITTILAIWVGGAVFFLLKPGKWGMALHGTIELSQVSVNTQADTSLLNTLINIVPSNLLEPFVESDTLQIIFLAVLIGAAVGMIGRYTKVLQDIFEACNELFLTITTIISKLIPAVVFASIFLMMIRTGADSIMAMISMAGTDILAMFAMMAVYGFLMLLLAGLNPLKFYKKTWPGMLTSFSLSSSNAAMPNNLRICTEELGISPKVCNFSIPLGATINMDGTSIHLIVASLFLARVYGVSVPQSAVLSIVLTILMLSLGTPGVPGASLVCLSILLYQIGVPIEAIGLIMGVDSLLDMFRTVSNTTGDMAVTAIVAKSEKLIDLKKYNDAEE